MRRQAFVATLALAAAANAQLNAEAPATLIDDGAGGVAYYTANVLVGGAPAPPFALSFRQDAASTLAWGTPLNSTHVRNTITSPREHTTGQLHVRFSAIRTPLTIDGLQARTSAKVSSSLTNPGVFAVSDAQRALGEPVAAIKAAEAQQDGVSATAADIFSAKLK